MVAKSGANFRKLVEIVRPVAADSASARLVADLIWGSFVGLSVLRDSRQNLGAPGDPRAGEFGREFELLLTGIAQNNFTAKGAH